MSRWLKAAATYVRLETLGFANCWVWLIVVLLDAAARLVFTHEMLAFAGKIQPLKRSIDPGIARHFGGFHLIVENDTRKRRNHCRNHAIHEYARQGVIELEHAHIEAEQHGGKRNENTEEPRRNLELCNGQIANESAVCPFMANR